MNTVIKNAINAITYSLKAGEKYRNKHTHTHTKKNNIVESIKKKGLKLRVLLYAMADTFAYPCTYAYT